MPKGVLGMRHSRSDRHAAQGAAGRWQVEAAARLANAHDFVAALPRGYLVRGRGFETAGGGGGGGLSSV